jgi:hypothetical protein
MRRLVLAVLLVCVAMVAPRAQITSPPSNYLSSYKAAILRDRPVAYWRMDASSGTAETDISGGGWPATLTGGFTLNVTGALSDGDKAMTFDGTNGTFLETSSIFSYPFGTGPMSVEFWFKTSGQASQAGILDDKTAGSNNAGFNVFVVDSGGALDFRLGNGSSQQGINTPLGYKDNAWHHFVGVLVRAATDTMQLFVDGSSVVGPTNLTTGWNITQSAVKLRIGAYTTGGSPNFFIGSLDDVALYNYPLSAAQVAAHYAARLYPTVQ